MEHILINLQITGDLEKEYKMKRTELISKDSFPSVDKDLLPED